MSNSVRQVTAARRPQALAADLADLARRVRELVEADPVRGDSASLAALYTRARIEVAADLAPSDFADVLAQTLIYAFLLVRRANQESGEPLTRALRAFLALPGLPPFARTLLVTLWRDEDAGATENAELTGCVVELANLLAETDLHA